jgi:3',5'-cyclic AMP phosphodiesterase CpdA
MLLAHISDTHLIVSGAAATDRASALDRTIAFLNAMSPRPAVVVHTGDVAHSGRPGEYDRARELFAALQIPIYSVVGNRDRRDGLKAAMLAHVELPGDAPFIQYGVEVEGVHLIAVDTLSDAGGLGDICAGRLSHLEAMLDQRAGRPAVIFLHHPPVAIPALHQPMQFRSPAAAQALIRVIARKPRVLGVLAGHTHREDFVALGPTHLTTAPSLAADLRKGRYPGRNPSSPVFHLHEVGQYGLRTRQVWLEPPRQD